MRVGATITLRPFAKINLTLAVGPRRADGFHDVRTLMQAISLADRLVLTRRRGPLALAVTGAAVAADRSNLVYRAAASLWRAMGRDGEPTGVDVRLDCTPEMVHLWMTLSPWYPRFGAVTERMAEFVRTRARARSDALAASPAAASPAAAELA